MQQEQNEKKTLSVCYLFKKFMISKEDDIIKACMICFLVLSFTCKQQNKTEAWKYTHTHTHAGPLNTVTWR